jgi:hypothetical protein
MEEERNMADQQQLARAYHTVLTTFVAEGRAPHYTELSETLELAPEEARLIQHELAESGLPFIVQPDTDYIAAVSPFSSISTHNRIAVEGERKWYAI